jgi:hypothetical protein
MPRVVYKIKVFSIANLPPSCESAAGVFMPVFPAPAEI